MRCAEATASGLAEVDPGRAARLVIQHAPTLRNLGRLDEALRVAIGALEPGPPRSHRSVRAYAAALTGPEVS